MLRNLFLVLLINFLSGVKSTEAVEIYANGHKYDSMQAYVTAKKIDAPPAAQAPLEDPQESYIRNEALKLGIKVDVSKVKTIQINQPDPVMHQFYVLGVEHGMVDALKDFYQTHSSVDSKMIQQISIKQLQEAIHQAVTASDKAKFLISQPGKLRIMSLSMQGSSK